MLTALLAASVLHARPLLLAHTMPWFEAPPLHKAWGWHWTMNHYDPNQVIGGRRSIASHYWPLIGPYDSGDPDVLEYQVLLMKFSGLDGAIVDWYGKDDVYDYASNHRNTLALIDALKKAKLKFAICFEDQIVPNLVKFGKVKAGEEVAYGKNLLSWMSQSWFKSAEYVRWEGSPLLLVFGPQFYSADQWRTMLSGLPLKVFGVMGDYEFATGGFAWPAPKPGDEAAREEMDSFYARARRWQGFVAGAYPRFHDIYAEAKVHESWGRISDRNGRTFAETLDQAIKSGSGIIQIATWNDWGEGTQVEPSAEFGFRDLERLQKVSGQYLPEDLRLPLALYRARKQGRLPKETLSRVSSLLFAGKVAEARRVLVH